MKRELTVVMTLFLGMICYGQETTNCEQIQCDCEHVAGGQEDPGLIDLCNYYEKVLKKKCSNGKKGLKCRDDAKGPNAWDMPKPNEERKPKAIAKPMNKAAKYNTVNDIIEAIKRSDNPRDTYKGAYMKLMDFSRTNSGLLLAMEITDLSVDVHYPAFEFNSALRFSKYASSYNDGTVDMVLKNMIKALSKIDNLGVDQIDTKYKLGELFNRLKAQGLEVADFFEEGRSSHDPDILGFIEECRASLHTGFKKTYMKQLRQVSTTIYLKDIKNMVPPRSSSKLNNAIQLITKDILSWNEKLLVKAALGLEALTKNIEHKNWDSLAINQAYLDYNTVFNEDLWAQERYLKSFKTVVKETPIVWDLMRAVMR